jgi:hypothetical protein
MIPLLKNKSTTPKRAILKVRIDRVVIRSNNINLKELNKRKGKESGEARAKRESKNRKIECDCVVSRSSGKLKVGNITLK